MIVPIVIPISGGRGGPYPFKKHWWSWIVSVLMFAGCLWLIVASHIVEPICFGSCTAMDYGLVALLALVLVGLSVMLSLMWEISLIVVGLIAVIGSVFYGIGWMLMAIF